MTKASPVALLFEDDPLLAMGLEDSLHDLGFEVITLTTCTKAEAWLLTSTPAVAVIDIHLTDGPCHHIAADLHKQSIPLIVYSGDVAGDYAETPFAQGTGVNKPGLPDEVAAAAAALVRG